MGNIPEEEQEPDGSRDALAFAFDDVARVTDSGEAEGRFSSSGKLYVDPESTLAVRSAKSSAT